MRFRFQHGTELVWSAADAVLASREVSNLVVMAVTIAAAILCARSGGLTGVIVNLPALGVIWGAVYELIRVGRWWRGVRPPEHQPPRRRRQGTP